MRFRRGLVAFSLAAGAALSITAPPAAAQTPHVPTEGPDVILGLLENVGVYAGRDGILALSARTVSCNKGNQVLKWISLREGSNEHPIISLNLFRLMDGRMVQVGQSWVKHGFFAEQGDVCGFGCDFDAASALGGRGLYPGCSDPYGAGLNSGPGLGPRNDINATTGHYEARSVVIEYPPDGPRNTDIRHGLQVREADLGQANARYFIEGHYIASDDSASRNAANNVSTREVGAIRNAQGRWTFPYLSDTIRERPAILGWPGASFAQLATPETATGGGDAVGRVIVGSKATAIAGGGTLYEYAVYNLNSDRSISSFSVPAGAAPVRDIGFSAVFSHGTFSGGKSYSNDPWTGKAEGGRVTWSTKPFAETELANAIRWGTMYNFWFTSGAGAADVAAELGLFKPGPNGTLVSTAASCAPGTVCVVKGPAPN